MDSIKLREEEEVEGEEERPRKNLKYWKAKRVLNLLPKYLLKTESHMVSLNYMMSAL